jgi:hypothetical protein
VPALMAVHADLDFLEASEQDESTTESPFAHTAFVWQLWMTFAPAPVSTRGALLGSSFSVHSLISWQQSVLAHVVVSQKMSRPALIL